MITSPAAGREDRRLHRDVERRITAAGGRDLFGQPHYRLVWGDTALKDVWGYHEAIPDRLPFEGWHKYPKYKTGRWHLEVLIPAHKLGDPGNWPAELGPFPSRGSYEHVLKLETPDGKYVEPAGDALDWLVRMVSKGSRTRAEIQARMQADEERAEADWESESSAIIDDNAEAFYGKPFVTVS